MSKIKIAKNVHNRVHLQLVGAILEAMIKTLMVLFLNEKTIIESF